jgi:hypothetical protein
VGNPRRPFTDHASALFIFAVVFEAKCLYRTPIRAMTDPHVQPQLFLDAANVGLV